MKFPRIAKIDQTFPKPFVESTEQEISDSFNSIVSTEKISGNRIAITAGSRGISGMADMLKTLIKTIRQKGGDPFIIPAMGSHGGATPEGQLHILSDYGITPETMGVPILASMETVCIGETVDSLPVNIAKTAFDADGVVVINRIKPHTDFTGEVESGLMKMITVGMGKIDGAKTFHSRTVGHSYDYLVQTIARKVLATGKILCGIAIIENAYHQTATIEAISPNNIELREKELLLYSKKLMPSLPVEKADILIIDRLGKNISGVGIDPNITGRRYRINHHWPDNPNITRLAVMDITPESMGNAVGVGLADFCSSTLVNKIDKRITYLNAVTSRNTICSNIPLHFDTDHEMMEQMLISIGDIPPEEVRLLRIRDTLSLICIEASEALLPELKNHPNVSAISELYDMEFDENQKLIPIKI